MQNFLDFKGKTALINGATGAIGKSVAQGLAQCGARVFISDLKQDMVDATVAELTAEGLDVAGLAADVWEMVACPAAALVASKVAKRHRTARVEEGEGAMGPW